MMMQIATVACAYCCEDFDAEECRECVGCGLAPLCPRCESFSRHECAAPPAHEADEHDDMKVSE